MRTIDADALDEVLEKIPAADIKNIDGQAYVLVRLSQVFNVIKNTPTIEPERKKGKWIDRGWSGDGRGNSWHEWECSECKHITKGAKWDFCPHCGADMTEEHDGKSD